MKLQTKLFRGPTTDTVPLDIRAARVLFEDEHMKSFVKPFVKLLALEGDLRVASAHSENSKDPDAPAQRKPEYSFLARKAVNAGSM